VSRDYAGRLEVVFSPGLFPDKLHPNQVDAECETIIKIPDAVGEAFRAIAQQCQEEVRRIAYEGRFGELPALHAKQSSLLRGSRSPETQPSHTAEQGYLDQYLAWLKQLPDKLATLPSIQKQAHQYVVERLPKFIYMDDFRVFPGKAILNEVKERRDKKKMQQNDATFLMILKLAGLDLDDLVSKGDSDDREQRQYDLDDGARTLTELFRNRLRQREYTVEFRADGQEFFTLVKDGSDASLIRLEERSKGFQWFFSFDMLFMHESGGNFANCVLLLDEPGLHLHPGAQRDLLARLEEYAKDNTLIYSTHLPFMLDLRHPERIRVINDGPSGTFVTNDLTQSQPEAKLTLQAALGMSASQSYLVAQRNIVVEGFDDNILISALSELLIRSGESGIPEDVLITHAGGASEAAHMATFMMGQRLDVVVLLDSDKAGDVARDKLVKAWLHRYEGKDNQVLKLGEVLGVGNREFAIEDLFDEAFYLKRVTDVYAKQLASVGCAELKLLGNGQLCKSLQQGVRSQAHPCGYQSHEGHFRVARDNCQLRKTADCCAEQRPPRALHVEHMMSW
jgi:5S rRNA maturation endonuclease (ribonuclease M5)